MSADSLLAGDLAREMAKGSKSFSFAAKFLPRDRVVAAQTLYWFFRHTDDIVDREGDAGEIREEFLAWSLRVDSALQGHPDESPALNAFVDVLTQYRIPRHYIWEFLGAMRNDLDGVRYATFTDLRRYCYGVASVVGLMMSHVIGFKHGALPYAIEMGIAMQLTNILRDVGEDLDRNRIYLPEEDMRRFGYCETQLRARERNDGFVAMMRALIQRADSLFELAMPGIDMLHREGRFGVRAAANIYRGILRQIERNGYDVFDRRAVVPTYRKLAIAVRSAL